MPSEVDVEKQLKKLAEVELSADVRSLGKKEVLVLKKLVEASKIMDEIYLRQVYSRNLQIRDGLMQSQNKAVLDYFTWNLGPWDRLDHDKPFIGTEKRREGVEFYPEDMAKEEFETWLEKHPEDREAFTSYYTVIRRRPDGLVAVPYSVEYKEFLEPAAKLLREAADISDNQSLKKFLRSRADAFLSNDYFQSEVDWMELDSNIEVTIGPYEVYTDGLFGYKAAFESFVTIKEPEESRRLQAYTQYLKEIDESLPIDPKFKFTRQSQSSPISVVTEIFAGGDANGGRRSTSFTLPNDDRIRELKGSKKILLKNVIEAKFNKMTRPLADVAIMANQSSNVTFDAYFDYTLFYQLSHGLGPAQVIMDDGQKVPATKLLKELYLPCEEAKAGVTGIYCGLCFIDKGILPKKMENEFYATLLTTIFGGIRFDLNEAHGKAGIVTYNYLKEKDAIIYDGNSEKFGVDYSKMRDALSGLLAGILNLQAEGSYEKAKTFFDNYSKVPVEVETAVGKFRDIPVHIYPRFKQL